MNDLIPLEVQYAANALGLDAATARIVTALEVRGIPSVLLKGPATVHWLYAEDPTQRTYNDIDLLVSPESFEATEQVLTDLGYENPNELTSREKVWLEETSWVREGSPPTYVDLHRGFHGVGDRDAWWAAMDDHARSYVVGGRVVRIPDRAGCALVVTLHDAVFGDEKAMTDLHRALVTFDEQVWVEAARRAAGVGAMPTFALGLSQHEAGRRLVEALRLPRHIPLDAAVLIRTGNDTNLAQQGRAWAMAQRLSRVKGRRERASALVELVFPSAGWLRVARPLARRGRLGLVLARFFRPFELAGRAPGVLRHLWRAQRRSRRSGR